MLVWISPLALTLKCSTPAVKKRSSSLSAPGVLSASINVSWSTSLTPPKEAQAVPLYPSNTPSVELKRTIPEARSAGRSDVVPTGTVNAPVVLTPITPVSDSSTLIYSVSQLLPVAPKSYVASSFGIKLLVKSATTLIVSTTLSPSCKLPAIVTSPVNSPSPST